jgi:Cyclopropane fatty acid synthase and related methyltransferases
MTNSSNRNYIPEVPFVPTPENVVRRMLKLAEVKPEDKVIDLGAGDGRVLIIGATEFKARCIGVEIRSEFVKNIEDKIRKMNLNDRIQIVQGNLYEFPLSEADVVTLYLLTSVNEKLKPKLEKELKPGARVVSHDFEIPGWIPTKVEEVYDSGRTHKIYLYIIPPAKKNTSFRSRQII